MGILRVNVSSSYARVWRKQHAREERRTPAQWRSSRADISCAIGPPSNSPAFAAACRPNDPMVQPGESQVKIW